MELNSLVAAILIWMTGLHTGFTIPSEPPTIKKVSRQVLCQLFVGKKESEITPSDLERCVASRVGAVYVEFDRADRTVHDWVNLPIDFDPRDPWQQAQLAHEIWHYVQCENGMYDALRKDETTVGAIETQGHRIQGMWYKQQNNPQAQAALFRNMSIN